MYELRAKVRLGGPIGDFIGFWGGPITGYSTNLVQGSYSALWGFLYCSKP